MLMNKEIKISLVSPVYNNEDNIEQFVDESASVLADIGEEFQIVLVNDASTDDTKNQLNFLLKKHPFLHVIHLDENAGQHIATSIALKQAKGEFVFMLDSDLQVSPVELRKMYDIALVNDDWEIISANRLNRSSSLVRRIGSYFVSHLINRICKTQLKDVGSTCKLIRRRALMKLFKEEVLIQNLPLLIAHMRLKQIEVDIQYNVTENISGYSFSALISALILAILNFTSGTKLIVFLLSLGFGSTTVSFSAILYLILRGILIQQPLPTNVLLFSVFLGVIGMFLIMLGIIAFKLERIAKNLDFRKKITRHNSFDE